MSVLFPKSGPPKFIQKPRMAAGGIGLVCAAIYWILTDPIWFESLYDRYRFTYPWITNGVLITIFGIWLFGYEFPRIWKKELFDNQLCWNCGHCVKGIVGDTCPECGFDEVARGIRAFRNTHGVLWLVGPVCRCIQRRRASR